MATEDLPGRVDAGADRLRIYYMTLHQMNLAITSQGNPDRASWPDDARIRDIWIDRRRYPRRICLLVSHPSFDPVAEYCEAPAFCCGVGRRLSAPEES